MEITKNHLKLLKDVAFCTACKKIHNVLSSKPISFSIPVEDFSLDQIDVFPSDINLVETRLTKKKHKKNYIQVPRGVLLGDQFENNQISVLPILMNPGYPKGKNTPEMKIYFEKIRNYIDGSDPSPSPSNIDTEITKFHDSIFCHYNLEALEPQRKYAFYGGVNLYLNALGKMIDGKWRDNVADQAINQLLRFKQSDYISKIPQHLLDPLLTSVEGVKRLGLTELVKCSTISNPTPLVQKICYSRFLKDEISLNNPQIILCFGDLVWQFLSEHKDTKERLIPVYHPSYFERKIKNTKTFEKVRKTILEQLKQLNGKVAKVKNSIGETNNKRL